MIKTYRKTKRSLGQAGVQSPYNRVGWMRLVYDVWGAVIERKVLVFSLLFLLVTLPILYLVIKYRSPIQAAWYDDAWGYRQTVAITNAGTAQTDFQVAITLNTSALVTAGKMQSDCDDIRITDISGKLLPIWIETGTNACNTTTTAIWTKVPSISTTGATVYLYYGNPSAVSVQNGNNVFIFFDDFSGSSIDSTKWTVHYGAPVVSSGLINFRGGVANDGITSIAMALLGTGNYSMEARHRINSGSNTWNFGFSDAFDGTEPNADDVNFQLCTTCSNTSWIFRDYSDAIYSTQTKDTEGLWRITKMSYIQNTNGIATTYSDDRASTLKTYTTTTSLPTMSLFDRIHFISHTKDADMDWVFIHKNAATLPSVASPTNEEKSQGPVAYWKFDEGYGTATQDSSPNNKSLTLSSSTTWASEDQCISGKCLKFDGTSTANVFNTSFDYNILKQGQETGSWTMAVWAKPSGSQAGGERVIMGRAGCHGGIYANANSIDFAIKTDGCWTNYKGITYTPTDMQSWHYLVAVYNNRAMSFYADGKLVGTNTFSATTYAYSNTMYLGGIGTYAFKGFIDEPKIYPYARTAAQIKSDFASKGSGSVKGTAASLGSSAKNSDAFSNGLVGYWKMDESAANSCTGGVNDSCDASGNSNDSAWNGTATSTSGKFGNGVTLDGDSDYLSLADSTSLSPSTQITMSAWVYPTLITGQRRDIIYGSNGYFLGINADGNATSYIHNGAWVQAAQNTGTTPQLNTWTLITSTYDGSQLITYVNGVAVRTISVTGSITDPSTIKIGSSPGGVGEFFQGNLDEARIYNRALSPREVRDLYNWAPGPVGYWNLDEKTGTSANDISGNGFNSTSFTGSPTWKLGKFGSSLDFTGTNKYVTLPAMTGKYSGMLTVSAWVYHTTSANWDDIVAGGCGDILFGFSNNQLNFGGQCNSPFGMLAYATNINNAWHYVTGTYDGSMARLYVDGIQVNSIARSGSFTPGVLTISRTAEDFQGQIDDVKIYNYARSSKQIIEDMNAGHPLGGSPVGSQVGYWKFDEGQGPKASSTVWNQQGTTTNLVPNPSFETGVGSWYAFGGNSTISQITSERFYGSGAGKLVGATTYAWARPRYNGISVSASTTYVLTAWVKGGTGSTGKAVILSMTGNSSGETTGSNTTLTTEWQKMTLLKTTNVSDTTLDIAIPIYNDTSGFTFYFDGIQLEAASSSTIYCDGSLTGNGSHSWNGTAHASTSTCTYGQDGEIIGPTWSNNGKFGKALSFDGSNDYVKSSPQTSFPTLFSFSGWINPSSAASTSYIFNPVGGHQGGGGVPNAQAKFYMNSNRTLSANIWTNTPGSQWETAITTTATVPLSQWSYVAYTFDGSKQKIYINGSLAAQTSSTTTGTTMSDSGSQRVYVIGADGENDTFATPFTGLIDEVKIYNAALTEDEIKLDMNQGAAMVLGSSLQLEDLYGNWVYYQDPARADVLDANNHSILLKSSSWCGHFPATISRTGTYQLYLEYSGTGTLYIDNDGINDNIWNTSLAATSSWQTYTVTKEFTTTGNHLLYFRTSGSNINIRYVKIKDVGPSASTSSYDYCVPGDPTACPAPVAEWKMDEKTGGYAYDTSGNGNVGTITNATWTQGKVGAALNFDGNGDYVNAGTFTSIDGKSAVTGEAWIYPTTVSPTNQEVFVKGTNTLLMRVDSGGVLVVCVNNTTCLSTASGTIVANQWQHIAYSWNTTTDTTYIYVNGRLITSGQETTTTISTGTMYIGSWAGSSEYFNGYIDHVKIYDYARTPAQIAWDYNRGAPVGHWKFDECQGIAANDSSGNGNSGTITIGATGTNTTAGTCTGSTGEAWKDGAIGKYNSSLEFDGTDDYIYTADSPSLDMGTMTISAWIKTGTSTTQYISERNNATYYFATGATSQKLCMYLNTVSNNWDCSTKSVTDGSWHHVVSTWDGTNKKLYIDGLLDSTFGGAGGNIANAAVGINIGVRITGGAPSGYFNGQIDDVRIYNYALTATQVKTLYNSGAAVQFAPLTGSP